MLLIGRQADRRLVLAVERWLEEQDEVEDVVDLFTMMTGTNRVLPCVRVDFAHGGHLWLGSLTGPGVARVPLG